MSIDWPRTVHRTGREADSVARACPVETYTPRRGSARWLIVAAATGLLAMAVVHLTRTGG